MYIYEQKCQPPWLANEGKFGYSSSLKNETLTKVINDSRSHIWNSCCCFFLNIISVSSIQLFYIRPYVSVDIIRAFFNS